MISSVRLRTKVKNLVNGLYRCRYRASPADGHEQADRDSIYQGHCPNLTKSVILKLPNSPSA